MFLLQCGKHGTRAVHLTKVYEDKEVLGEKEVKTLRQKFSDTVLHYLSEIQY